MKFKLILFGFFVCLPLQLFPADIIQIEKCFVHISPRFCSGSVLGEVSKIELLAVNLKEIQYKVFYKEKSKNFTRRFFTNQLINISATLKDKNNYLVLVPVSSKQSYNFSLNSQVVFENHSSISNISSTIHQSNMSSYQGMSLDSLIKIPIGRVCSSILLKGLKGYCLIYEALFQSTDNIQELKICTIKSNSLLREPFNENSFLSLLERDDLTTRNIIRIPPEIKVKMCDSMYNEDNMTRIYLVLQNSNCLVKDIASKIFLLFYQFRFKD